MPSPQANDKPWQLHPGFHTRPCSTPSHHHNTMILFRGRVILAFGRIVHIFAFLKGAPWERAGCRGSSGGGGAALRSYRDYTCTLICHSSIEKLFSFRDRRTSDSLEKNGHS